VLKSPSHAIQNGIGLLPEDRKNEGLTLETSIEHNINLASYHEITTCGVINLNKEQSRSKQQIDDLRIKAFSEKQKVVNLSGGNQQKVVIGKWL
jgi:ribose transport system ATP-binding protein